MAFHSSHVDQNIEEQIECTSSSKCENSGRSSVCSSPLKTFKVESGKGCPCYNNVVDHNDINDEEIVRHINPAAFVIKSSEGQNVSVEYDENLELKSNRSSLISHDEISNCQCEPHIILDNNLHIPFLNLNFNDTFSSNGDSYSYSKIKEVTRIIEKPDAFQGWLKAKQAAKIYQAKFMKEEEEKRQIKKIERKKAAEDKFQEWVQKKLEKEKFEKQKIQAKIEQPKTVVNNDISEVKKISFDVWLENKRNKEKTLQQERKKKLLCEQKQKLERKKKANILYTEWLKIAHFKPKPVPLNKGLLTLKGTISNIFINPEPWNIDKCQHEKAKTSKSM